METFNVENTNKVENEIEDPGFTLKISLWLTLPVLLIGGFMAMLDSSIVNVAIPSMMNAFGVSSDSIEWVLTIYMLVLGVVVPMSGWLGDFLGLKKFYLLSLIVFTVGSAFCAFAWNVPSLTIARAIQAVGGGMIMPITMAMVYRLTPRDQIGKAMGLFGMIFVFAPAIGPTVGGYLVEYVNWRWIFTINIPIGILGLVLGAMLIPEIKSEHPGRFDWWGAITSAIALFCILFALSEGSSWGYTSIEIILLLYTSAVFFSLFIYHQLTTKEPLLDLRVFKNLNFTLGNILLVIITIGMYGALFYIPIFLQSIMGIGALKAGLIMLLPALASAIMMPISGAMYDKIGPKVPIILGLIIITGSTLALSFLDVSSALSTIIEINVVRSMGMGLVMMTAQTALMSEIPTEKVGRATSVNNILTRVAASFGIAALTIIMSQRSSVHVANLSNAISTSNPMVVSKMKELATNLANGTINENLANSMVSSLLGKQIFQISFVQSMNDVFIITAIITAIAIIPGILIRKKIYKEKTKEVIMEEIILEEVEGKIYGC